MARSGTSFKPGQGGKPKGAKSPPKLLRDMRAVYEKPKGEDGTEARKALRKMFDENPVRFMEQLQRLEATWAARKDPPAAAKPDSSPGKETPTSSAEDLGTERCVGLAEKLLRELGLEFKHD